MTVGIYAGSFDPFTKGHLAVATQAGKGLDKLIIAIGHNPAKKGLFSVQEREEMILREAFAFVPCELSVASFDGLLASFCRTVKEESKENVVIVRGLRAVSDFEQEMAIAYANSMINLMIPTFFVPAATEYAFVSSSGAKQLAAFPAADDALDHYVSPRVADALKDRIRGTAGPQVG